MKAFWLAVGLTVVVVGLTIAWVIYSCVLAIVLLAKLTLTLWWGHG